jgi:hypothetical protein
MEALMKRLVALLVSCLMVISMSGCGDLDSVYDDDTTIIRSGDSNSTTGASSTIIGNDLSVTATLTGSRTIWRYDAETDTDATFSYSLSVSSGGKAKLVLITPDNEVIVLAENTDNTTDSEIQTQTVSLQKGEYRIKIVGQAAPKLTLKLSVDVGQLGW